MKIPESLIEPGANGHSMATPSAMATEFRNFVADVDDLIKATTLLTGEELARAKAKLGARIASAKTAAGEMGGAIADSARRGATATNTYVHEQPWTAIGAGAAAGLLLGFLLARRA
jgi:ElaB/YqjD/DUF883 family membrane-anchored ribosome-binding protein